MLNNHGDYKINFLNCQVDDSVMCVKLMVGLEKIRVHNLGIEIHTLFAHFAKTSICRVIIIAFSIPNRVNRMNVFIFVYWNVISFNIAVLRNEEIHVIV